jgi:molybdate transport system substrate-binding protein
MLLRYIPSDTTALIRKPVLVVGATAQQASAAMGENSMRRYLAAALAFLIMVSSQAHAEPVRVMAAFVFKTALDDVVHAYKAQGGGDVVMQYGMTPMLAKQVENLAPADVFLSADAEWMNYLQNHNLIQVGTRVDLLTADLVLVARGDNAAAPTNATMGRDFPLQKIVGTARVAMCNPAHDPAGRLGRAGLETLGLWQGVEDRIALAQGPPAAVALVERGEAPAAVVFSANAAGVVGIKIAGVFPKDSHPPIVFPAAILRDSHNADAARFLTFLKSEQAMAVFKRFGYRPLVAAH